MGLAFGWPGIGYGLYQLRFEEQGVEASSQKFPDFRRAGVSSQSAASCRDHAFWGENIKVAGGGRKSVDCQRVIDFPLLGA